MIIVKKEFRITLPLKLEEYNIGQLYNVIDMSKENIGTKVKIETNEEVTHEIYGTCQKTVKQMDLSSHLPSVVRLLFPSKLFKLEELAFNSFPECRTFYKSCYAEEKTFKMLIHSKHVLGNKEDVFGNGHEIINVNLCKKVHDKKYNIMNFSNQLSKKIHLKDGWIDVCESQNIPYMTCHKFVTLELDCFKEDWLASKILSEMDSFFAKTHQRIYASVDQWHHLTIEDIRRMEDQTFFNK